jgi:hypothetical protein
MGRAAATGQALDGVQGKEVFFPANKIDFSKTLVGKKSASF